MSESNLSANTANPLNDHADGEEAPQTTIFSNQPPIFILPTHLPIDRLDSIENTVVLNGGTLTYDIAEAGIVLGKVAQKKRGALELRSRGLWTEELPDLTMRSTLINDDDEPPSKRRKTSPAHPGPPAGVEVVDRGTESESEEDGVRSRHDPARHLALATEVPEPKDSITLLSLDWLHQSVAAGRVLPRDSFVVFRGRKIVRPAASPSLAPPAVTLPLQQNTSGILQRAKEDAFSQPSAASSQYSDFRRSKEPPGGQDSQRQVPTLYRQTTSEHDEVANLPPQPDWVRDRVAYACMRSAPLHPPNEDFIAQLVKIRRIRELTLDEIGVRAYSTSIAAIAAYPYVIKRPSEILALPGCEVKIANLFTEYQQRGICNHTDEDGNISAADALETDPVLQVLNQFNLIWGVGVKTARDFYYHRGWRDLDDIVEHGWNSLSRVQQIGVKFFDEFLQGVSRRDSEIIAETVRDHANRVRPEAEGNIECVIVGGYRRGKEMSGDVDVIVTHRDPTVTESLIVDLVASLETEKYVTHTLSLHLTATHRDQQTLTYRGDEPGRHFDSLDKALVVWQDPEFDRSLKKNPNTHRRVDIIISPWQTVGCAILGWSGDTTFERDLRRYVKKAHGWKFDSSGVRQRTAGGRVMDLEEGGETWQERERLLMERLGIGWRPPHERCTR
ncbi:Uncharacterized protein PECH_006312 [Penicillium ucsense]|uniref:BRCT domain-containing protein n=1 Tax=Penicillium ucsense TaxID=2839758 RepID=A0A8J8W693_9EURO|nr:Uncharacterized protein PECM_000355 [Penicillium ucsense]KAF7739107.1 Uncharacterized protein PECH_006312 [Penicillium ucsense]